MNNQMQILLHGRKCPYNYQCAAVDCLECMKLYQERREDSNGC